MAANTIVLMVVAGMAALVLAGMILAVAYKTRTQERPVNGETLRDQAEEDLLRRRQALAEEYAARAHAAQVEIDVKTIRA
jgi:hypothetical protein